MIDEIDLNERNRLYDLDYCQDCHMMLPCDKKMHKRICIAWAELEAVIGRPVLMHRKREERKVVGYELLNSKENIDRVNGAIILLESWYDRDLNSRVINNDNPIYLSFVDYLRDSIPSCIPDDIVNILHKRYGITDAGRQRAINKPERKSIYVIF